MSEFTVAVNAYFENTNHKKQFIIYITELNEILFDGELFQIQNILDSSLVSFTLFGSGYSLEKTITKWLADIPANYIVADLFADELDKTIAFRNGKKTAVNKVIKEIALVSTTFAAALAFKAGPLKALKFIQSNDVDLFEKFQGIRHIDYLFSEYVDYYPKLFDYLAETGVITDDLLLTDGYTKNSKPTDRAVFQLEVSTAVKVLKNGNNPEIFYEQENELLKCFHFHNDSLEDLKYIYERSQGEEYSIEKHARKPVTDLFENLNYQDKISKSKELEYVEKLKIIINHRENLQVIDGFAERCLANAQGYNYLQQYLKETLPSLAQ